MSTPRGKDDESSTEQPGRCGFCPSCSQQNASQSMPSLADDQSRAGHGEGALQHPTPISRHLKPHSHTSWGSRLRVVLLALPLPLEGGRGLAPRQTPRLGAAVGFYKARDSGGLFLPWQTPGSLVTLEPLTPTHSLKSGCFRLPWTRHTHPHRGLPPRLTPR